MHETYNGVPGTDTAAQHTILVLLQEAPLEPLVVMAGASGVLSKNGFFAGE